MQGYFVAEYHPKANNDYRVVGACDAVLSILRMIKIRPSRSGALFHPVCDTDSRKCRVVALLVAAHLP
jgi:hypothetical protein